MPELPEVQALADVLETELRGDVVARIDIVSISVLKTFDPPPTAVQGLAIDGVRRLGKHLVIAVDEFAVVIHLARAGWVRMRAVDPATPTPRSSKSPLSARILLASGQALDLTDASTQKKVALHIVRDVMDVPSVARLGPDPLAPTFDAQALDAILATAGRAQLKGVLRSQSVIAGIGNAYSDEILHAARLSPFAAASGLDDDDRSRLLDAIKSLLADAVETSRGKATTELKDAKRATMSVHGRTGQDCPVCGDVVREVVFADSSLQYCATCQTGGKPLKDRSTSRFLK
jgi:formamidopyrimidine-DNA glycosylase